MRGVFFLFDLMRRMRKREQTKMDYVMKKKSLEFAMKNFIQILSNANSTKEQNEFENWIEIRKKNHFVMIWTKSIRIEWWEEIENEIIQWSNYYQR